MREGEPKREPVKNEGGLDEQIKRDILEHLNYQEKKTQSLIEVGKRLTFTYPKSREAYLKTKDFFRNYYEKAIKQLEKGQLGEELLSELSSPSKEEYNFKKEIQIYQNLLNKLTPEQRKGDVGKFIIEKLSSSEVAYLSYKAERRSWLEKLSKKFGREKGNERKGI